MVNNLPVNKTWEDVQWKDLTNEHLMVWMRTAGLSTFRKIYGTIEGGLEPGEYKLYVDNQFEV